MYNFRYHIITVTSIFIALAIGLLLGVAVGRSNAVQVTTDSLVESLNESLDTIQQENDALEQRSRSAEEFGAMLAQAWVDGRLSGASVLVVYDGGSSACAQIVDEAVATAGGSTVGVRLAVPDSAGDGLADFAQGLLEQGLIGQAPADGEQLAEQLGLALAAEWAAAGGIDGEPTEQDCPLTAYLRAAGVLACDAGLGEVVGAAAVVDVSSDGGELSVLGLSLASGLAQAGRSVATAQLSGDEGTLVSDGWVLRVPGIAQLDGPYGPYGLVALLSGAQPDAYGVDGHDAWPQVPAAEETGASASSSLDAAVTSVAGARSLSLDADVVRSASPFDGMTPGAVSR